MNASLPAPTSPGLRQADSGDAQLEAGQAQQLFSNIGTPQVWGDYCPVAVASCPPGYDPDAGPVIST